MDDSSWSLNVDDVEDVVVVIGVGENRVIGEEWKSEGRATVNDCCCDLFGAERSSHLSQ